MFAVIKTGGKQYLVEEGTRLKIEKILGDVGTEIVFDQVLLQGNSDGSSLKVGRQTVAGATVSAKILEQKKDKKIRVIKFKRKIRYKREHGHRQNVTVVKITSVK